MSPFVPGRNVPLCMDGVRIVVGWTGIDNIAFDPPLPYTQRLWSLFARHAVVIDRERPQLFTVSRDGDCVRLCLAGDWVEGSTVSSAELLRACTEGGLESGRLCLEAADDLCWDSLLASRLFQLVRHCESRAIPVDDAGLPVSLRKLLGLALAVRLDPGPRPESPGVFAQLGRYGSLLRGEVVSLLGFVGELVLALLKLVRGRSQTRVRDLFYFIEQCGPKALGIVALISVLVGMILAYLGAVQLRQLGAEVFVANLVALGMVREMGPLMTAVIMAGRTGAAYAAQLGTMQANEEIDAVTTLGLSPMEYLVVPRLLALVLVMPLLVVFANVVGLVGGAVVAAGMDVNFMQFLTQAREAVGMGDIVTGLVKSLVFAALIAVAGCQAGLLSGRTSAAVGNATTRAVVNAIVYLVVADAAFNILYSVMGV